MSREQNQKTKTPKLSDDFESVAERLECDDDKARFEAKLGKLAKAKSGETKARGNSK
jgi:hypothetical protein